MLCIHFGQNFKKKAGNSDFFTCGGPKLDLYIININKNRSETLLGQYPKSELLQIMHKVQQTPFGQAWLSEKITLENKAQFWNRGYICVISIYDN